LRLSRAAPGPLECALPNADPIPAAAAAVAGAPPAAAAQTVRRRRGRLLERWPVAVPVAALLLSITLGTVLAGYFIHESGLAQSEASGERIIADGAAYTARMLFEAEVRRLETVTHVLAADRDLAAALRAVHDGQPATALGDLMDRNFGGSGIGQLVVQTATGKIAYRTAGADAPGEPEAGRALKGLAGTYFSVGARTLSVRVLEPVLDDAGVAGVLSAVTRFDDFYALRLADQVGADVYLASRFGVWAASSDARRAGVFDPAMIARAIDTRSPVRTADARTHTLVYTPIRLVDETFVLIVDVDHARTAALVGRIQRNSLLLFAVTVLIVLLAGAYLVRRLVRPIRALRDEASVLASRFDSNLSIARRRNEIAGLEDSFDALHRALGTYAADLERQRAELETLSLVASRTDNVVLITDRAGQVDWFNAAFVRLAPETAATARGLPVGAVLHELDAEAGVLAIVKRAVADGTHFETDLQGRSPGRGPYWLHITGQPIATRGATVDRFIVLGLDITERKSQETALLAAKDAADTANRAKSQFLANMSHEIRTPMNGVLGMTEVLLGSGLDDRQRALAETVYRSGDALLAVIDDILDFSRMEAGRLVLDASPFDLRRVVGHAFKLVEITGREKHLDLGCRVDDAVPQVLIGDAGRLRQVLLNLLANAVKFTDQGQVALSVTAVVERAARDRPDTAALTFEVRDTGCGIDAPTLGRLFRPFTQANDSDSRKHGGTGLGLAITRHLVEMMGGRVMAESQPGAGSTFRVLVRLAVADAAARGAPQRVRSVPSALAAKATGERPAWNDSTRVLVVEDNPVNRAMLLSMLSSLKCPVAMAENGVEALEQLAKQRFALILMDCQMPVMDGFEAVRIIRRGGEGKYALSDQQFIPIVAVTANALAGDRERCLAAGFTDYLAKPFRKAALVEILKKHLPPAHDGTPRDTEGREADTRDAHAREDS